MFVVEVLIVARIPLHAVFVGEVRRKDIQTLDGTLQAVVEEAYLGVAVTCEAHIVHLVPAAAGFVV